MNEYRSKQTVIDDKYWTILNRQASGEYRQSDPVEISTYLRMLNKSINDYEQDYRCIFPFVKAEMYRKNKNKKNVSHASIKADEASIKFS